MITRITAKSYGPLRDVTTPELTPLHAFIGPNDSGKSSLLRAARVALQFAGEGFHLDNGWRPFAPELAAGTVLRLSVGNGASYQVSPDGPAVLERLTLGGEITFDFPRSGASSPGIFQVAERILPARYLEGTWPFLIGSATPEAVVFTREQDVRALLAQGKAAPIPPTGFVALRDLHRAAQFIRFSPDALRRPTFLDAAEPPHFLNDRGLGIGGALDRLRDRDERAYERLRDSLLAKFPFASGLAFDTFEGGKKAVALTLKDGTRVPSSSVSEGFLYYLAFSLLQTFCTPHASPT
jgi:hypothetical protein